MTKDDEENPFRSEFIPTKTVILKERGLSMTSLAGPGEQSDRDGETEKRCNVDVAWGWVNDDEYASRVLQREVKEIGSKEKGDGHGDQLPLPSSAA
jgi:hypothetical protein